MDNKYFKQIINFVVIVGLSVAAGAFGASLAIGSATSASEIILAGQPSAPLAARAGTSANLDAVSSAARGAVTFYRARAGTGLDGVFLPTDAVGEGVVLTADGWIASAESVFANQTSLIAVFDGGAAATVPLGKVVKDDATGIAFVRVEQDHLNVAPFGDDTALLPGETVYVAGDGGVAAASVVAVRELPVAVKSDLVESSEKFARRLVLGTNGLMPGAPVVDAGGNIVAIAAGTDLAVPVAYFTGVMKDVFLNQKIVRPVLGAHYVSVADAVAAPSANLPASGALITGGGKIKAVTPGSAADLGGLREGDVILAVERDRIEKDLPLSEDIAEYAPGAKLGLTVERGGSQIKLSVTLK